MSVTGEPEVQPPGASQVVVLCPQCHTRNNPQLARCSACGADLLPSRVSEVDIEPSADAATVAEANRLQRQLVEAGLRRWVGYCRTCKRAVTANLNQRCDQCGTRLKGIQLVLPEEHDVAVATVNREHVRRRRSKSVGIALAVVALVACIVVPLAVVLPQLVQKMATRPTPTPLPTATPLPPAVFGEDVFSFSYPAGWWRMGPTEAKLVRMASFQDMTSDVGSYIGGVFTEGVDSCRDCAQIVVSVARDPGLIGTLTEAQYQALHAASEQALGARLLSQRRVEVSSLPAVESVYLDVSGDAKVWEFMIVPPQPGVAYRVTCSSHKDSFAAFETVFQQAIVTLHIAGEALATGPTRVPPRTPSPVPVRSPTPVRTYKVQAGDVLGQIAKNLGVSLEALAEANGLQDPYVIQPGQVLTVPVMTP